MFSVGSDFGADGFGRLAETTYDYTIGVSISGFAAPYFAAMCNAMNEAVKKYPGVELKILMPSGMFRSRLPRLRASLSRSAILSRLCL